MSSPSLRNNRFVCLVRVEKFIQLTARERDLGLCLKRNDFEAHSFFIFYKHKLWCTTFKGTRAVFSFSFVFHHQYLYSYVSLNVTKTLAEFKPVWNMESSDCVQRLFLPTEFSKLPNKKHSGKKKNTEQHPESKLQKSISGLCRNTIPGYTSSSESIQSPSPFPTAIFLQDVCNSVFFFSTYKKTTSP